MTTTALTEGDINSEWTMIPVDEVTVKERLRKQLDESHVKRLMESFTDLGFQIHPITVDEYHTLIAGAHRLEAMRRLTADGMEGWDKIGALVVTGAS
ncbi:MAG: ParB N-terminal domain-containing protein [Leucobacter sp.]|nr:ParB N-terminal domain-containing protein [Leucobacter sp.]